MKPFARVNEVSDASPAEQAQLRVNDLVVKFGSVNYDNNNGLKSVAELVRGNLPTYLLLLLLL